ncbi:polyprenyl synthetase family protein [Actinomadura roseirufa]|uniref:polyprenyl synthetase family protein n=1 Tax=Actinomadura roseirufa TaxID=2094049 RepID=UPI0013F1712A|nr:polyprenyl synthetase family protein [Actinomadura roseirufa]
MTVSHPTSSTVGGAADVRSLLGDARDLVLPALRAAVDGLHPDLARLCGYHFGWCDENGTPAGHGDGKYLRAALVSLSAQAAGAGTESAVPGAVAVELVHNFSLLHDDIMDSDDRRRGRSAAWAVFGVPASILAGDALIALALGQLTPLAGEVGRDVTRLLVGALDEMICGQAADLALDTLGVADVTTEHYVAATGKTTALLSCCTAIGARLGGAPVTLADQLREATRHLGLSWQLANDVEDIWGDPVITGKPAFSDLRGGKKTFPVIAALRSGTPAGRSLATALDDARATVATAVGESALSAWASAIEAAGGRARAERLSRDHLDRAVGLLTEALPESPARERLIGLFRLIVTRDAPPRPAATGAQG